jgi:hypothetical protein
MVSTKGDVTNKFTFMNISKIQTTSYPSNERVELSVFLKTSGSDSNNKPYKFPILVTKNIGHRFVETLNLLIDEYMVNELLALDASKVVSKGVCDEVNIIPKDCYTSNGYSDYDEHFCDVCGIPMGQCVC